MIRLTHKQTLELALLKLKRTRREHPTTSRMKWICLGCLKEIYVSFKQSSIRAIYCDECLKNKNINKNTIVELRYVQKLKDAQMHMFDNFLMKQIVKVDEVMKK